MPILIGILLAVGVFLFGRIVGLDRDRAFYPTVLVVVASLYDLFAVMGGSMPALGSELVVTAGFLILVVLGFRYSQWITVAGLAGHGIFDFFHGGLIANPGVPGWWPAFCLSYDVTAAVGLAWLLWRASPRTAPGQT
jgi:hypothetical protein